MKMKMKALLATLVGSVLILSGCMMPDSEKAGTMIPYEEQIQSVQNAIERYQEASGGLLPIKTRDQEVDQYIKYPIDFAKIVPDYMPEIPPNAFETGGIFQYVLMDVEENPTVKLVDLQIPESIRSINIRKGANGGRAPIAETIADNVYKLNYEAMGFSGSQEVVSPYTGRGLPFIVNGNGQVFVDYSIDLYSALQEYDGEIEPGEDIRFLLYADHPVVPAYSLPYTVDENGEPVFLEN